MNHVPSVASSLLTLVAFGESLTFLLAVGMGLKKSGPCITADRFAKVEYMDLSEEEPIGRSRSSTAVFLSMP